MAPKDGGVLTPREVGRMLSDGKVAVLFEEKPTDSQSNPIPIGHLGLQCPASLASSCHGHFTISLVLRESVPR